MSLSEAEFGAAIQGLTVVALDGPATGSGATAVASGAASSNGEARRLIAQGGLYVNDRRVEGFDDPLPAPVHGRYWVVRTGKKNVRIVERAGLTYPARSRRTAITSAGARSRSASRTSAW